ncbi:Cytoskeleton-associated protein 5 [Phytophthora ramorum]|uniref:Cytoskeleton-associated protein 5 n=1 Tax=Phytophthora ramorum TaxID=164328 RepID=UPI003098757F|nr:Cytoskeleton-associated protein 5 [Phytophthora ramorum]
MARVTDKGFSARPGIVKLCEELVDAFIAAGAAEETVIALLEGTSNRKPKVPPACLTCTLEALKAYGPRVVPLQAIKSALPKLMEGAVKVRQISMDIMVEIHRKLSLKDKSRMLCPAKQHLQSLLKEQSQLKLLVEEKQQVPHLVQLSQPQPFDPRDFAETVDLLAKLPKTEFKTKLALPKWSEKVEALKIVLEVIGPVPKLANGDYYELVSTLKALTNDSNVNIVAKSIELFGALADGLHKKSVILSATNKTLDMFLQHAMPIDMMMDDLKLACDASKNKAPPARVQTMAFVARAVENRYVDVNDKALIVAFGLMFMKGVNDTDPKDFGISICNPRALIDFAKGPLGLESSNPKVRSAAISLLSTMYSQLGPALLPILNLESWKPALAAAVESEFKKVGFDPTKAMASVKRQVKDQDEASAAADPGALFGRVDVSSQITKELLGDMKNESDKVAWKKRAEAMDTVQSICESAGCAIEFTRPVQEVLRGLKARLNDSNANLKVKATNVIAIVATSVGPDIAKMSKILGASLIAGVADNKKTCKRHPFKLCTNGAELLGWASEHLQNSEKLDLNCLVAPTVQCMMDKSSEAREKAQLLLVEVMKSVGKDMVFTTGCRDIKPAAMRALKPLLQKVCDAVEASGAATSTNQTSSILAPSAAPTQPPAPFASGHSSASSGIARGGIRRRASASAAGGAPAPGLKSRLTRPSSFRAPTAASEMIEKDAAPLLKMSSNKPARIAKGQYNKWIFEVTSVSEMNSRKGEVEAEWKPFLSPEFHAKLFAPSLEKGMLAAMDDLRLCVLHQADEVVSSLDLIFKWCSLRIVDNNVQALAKLLEVLIKLFEMLKDTGYQLDDVEAAIILPYLLQESVCTVLDGMLQRSKNMKSRCECIDLVEYIVSIHGYHVIGRKCIKDVGKYVVAHEKELRESAINTLVAVYVRTEGGNPDKFFRLAGITTQQGIDLLNARLKHLPASSLPNGNTALAEQEIAPEQEMLQQQQRTGFGFGFARTPATTVAAPTNIFSQDSEGGVSAAAQPIAEPIPKHGVKPYDDDIDMNAPNEEIADGGLAIETIQRLLLDPIKKLVDTSKQVVRTDTPEYKESVNALKGLYAIISRPSDPSEVEFLNSRVNDIIIALCDAIHGAFYAGDTEKRPEMFILAISIATLTAVFKSDVVTNIDRSVVERVLLELCSKIMDDRMVKFSDKANLPDTEISAMSPEDKRYLMVFKSLYKAMRVLTERARPGDVYPSVINLLQRLLHNGVGDYNKNGSLKHLQAQDSLDQLVGRILLKLSNVQANSLHPFEGIDIYGVLMQMQTFFSTLPKACHAGKYRQRLHAAGIENYV